MHAHITVVGGAVEAQVDAKGHRRPGGVLRAAVEAYLWAQAGVSGQRWGLEDRGGRTLLAGLVLSFSKIFCDSCLVAAMVRDARGRGRAFGVRGGRWWVRGGLGATGCRLWRFGDGVQPDASRATPWPQKAAKWHESPPPRARDRPALLPCRDRLLASSQHHAHVDLFAR